MHYIKQVKQEYDHHTEEKAKEHAAKQQREKRVAAASLEAHHLLKEEVHEAIQLVEDLAILIAELIISFVDFCIQLPMVLLHQVLPAFIFFVIWMIVRDSIVYFADVLRLIVHAILF